jgi:hypothetical protein
MQACLDQALRPLNKLVFGNLVDAANRFLGLALDPAFLIAEAEAAGQTLSLLKKYVRPGKRATDDGEWQFFVRRIESRARLPPSHRGWAVGAIAFERRVCGT